MSEPAKCTASECCRGRIVADDWAAPNHDCPDCCGTGLALDVEAILARRHTIKPDDRRLTLEWWQAQCGRLVIEFQTRRAAEKESR